MAIIEKNIGVSRTINTVQKKRKILSVAMDHDGTVYGLTIIYREYEVDGGGAIVNEVDLVKKIDNATLGAAAKTEIDSVFTRALAAV